MTVALVVFLLAVMAFALLVKAHIDRETDTEIELRRLERRAEIERTLRGE